MKFVDKSYEYRCRRIDRSTAVSTTQLIVLTLHIGCEKKKTILQVIRGKVHYTISTESRASIQFYQPSVGYAQILKFQTKWASHIESISMLIEKYVLI